MSWNATEPAGWTAAHEAAVAIERRDLAILRVWGRDPVRMIQGLVTNEIAALPAGDAVRAAMLTPKGRMLADLRIIRRPDDLLLICDARAAANVRDTMRKYVPPLFARFEDAPGLGILGIYGPASDGLLQSGLGLSGDGDDRPGRVREDHGFLASTQGEDLFVIRDADAGVPGWLIVAPAGVVADLERTMDGSAIRADLATFDLLRIEAGRPRWGAELTEEVIPIEAGITDRAISTTKGCYTGQEVIIRILHRGHVNRRLMGLRLGDVEPPAAETPLYRPGESKPVARITSSAASPSLRETVALGYVRREVEAGAVLALGSADGPEAIVTDLPFV